MSAMRITSLLLATLVTAGVTTGCHRSDTTGANPSGTSSTSSSGTGTGSTSSSSATGPNASASAASASTQ